MKAIVQNGYGSTNVLELKDVDKPVVEENAQGKVVITVQRSVCQE